MRCDLLAGLVLLSLACRGRIIVGRELPVGTDTELPRASDGGAPPRDGGPIRSGSPPAGEALEDEETNSESENDGDTDTGANDGNNEAGDNEKNDD